MENEDNICALCKWNKNVNGSFFCGHKHQESERLHNGTSYNDSCILFDEKEERKSMYDFLDKKYEQ